MQITGGMIQNNRSFANSGRTQNSGLRKQKKTGTNIWGLLANTIGMIDVDTIRAFQRSAIGSR